MYKYKLGLIVGRFQPIHIGHISIIKKALEDCEKVIIGIGDADVLPEDNDDRNPLPYFLRHLMITNTIYNSISKKALNRVSYIPLVRIGAGDSPVWGNYVMNYCKFTTEQYPDAYYTGSEPDRNHWLENYDVETVVVSRANIDISATQLREAFHNNDTKLIEKYMPKMGRYYLSEIKYYLNKESNI